MFHQFIYFCQVCPLHASLEQYPMVLIRFPSVLALHPPLLVPSMFLLPPTKHNRIMVLTKYLLLYETIQWCLSQHYRVLYFCSNSMHAFTLSIGIWSPPIVHIRIPRLHWAIIGMSTIPLCLPKPLQNSLVRAKMFSRASFYYMGF
jgi:hypothetical protein